MCLMPSSVTLNLRAKCRWQNTSLQMTTSLDSSTVDFLLGFARLCYHLVKSGNIKMTALLNVDCGGDTDAVNNTLSFPDLGGVCIDQVRSWGVSDKTSSLRGKEEYVIREVA